MIFFAIPGIVRSGLTAPHAVAQLYPASIPPRPLRRTRVPVVAGWAGYGYGASDSRFYRGLKLFSVCTPAGLHRLRSRPTSPNRLGADPAGRPVRAYLSGFGVQGQDRTAAIDRDGGTVDETTVRG